MGQNYSKSDTNVVWERISWERKGLSGPQRARDNGPTPNCPIPKIDPILVRTIFFFCRKWRHAGMRFCKIGLRMGLGWVWLGSRRKVSAPDFLDFSGALILSRLWPKPISNLVKRPFQGSGKNRVSSLVHPISFYPSVKTSVFRRFLKVLGQKP